MWRTLNSQIQGRGHVRGGVPCQDKTCCCRVGRVRAAALADGAGSAPLSHFGAAESARRIAHYLAQNFYRLRISQDINRTRREIIANLREGLEALAREKGCAVEDLASTLLAVAVTDEEYIVLHLGDGVIACLAGDEVKAASVPENGEFANSTVFVTSNGAENSLRLLRGPLGRIRGFALMSDGAAAGLFNKQTREFAPALSALMSGHCDLANPGTPEALRTMLTLLRASRTADDCSVALISKVSGTLDDFLALPEAERFDLLCLPDAGKKLCRRAVARRRQKLIAALPATLGDLSARLRTRPSRLRRRLSRMNAVIGEQDGVYRFTLHQ